MIVPPVSAAAHPETRSIVVRTIDEPKARRLLRAGSGMRRCPLFSVAAGVSADVTVLGSRMRVTR